MAGEYRTTILDRGHQRQMPLVLSRDAALIRLPSSQGLENHPCGLPQDAIEYLSAEWSSQLDAEKRGLQRH